MGPVRSSLSYSLVQHSSFSVSVHVVREFGWVLLVREYINIYIRKEVEELIS